MKAKRDNGVLFCTSLNQGIEKFSIKLLKQAIFSGFLSLNCLKMNSLEKILLFEAFDLWLQ